MRWVECAHVRLSVAMTSIVLASGFLLLKGNAVRAGAARAWDVANEVRIVPRRGIRQAISSSRQPQSPAVYLSGQKELKTQYAGSMELRRGLEENHAQGLSLASSDFDEDGVQDLVCGYAFGRGGLVAVHRGNVDLLYPNSPEAKQRKAAGVFVDSPFLSPARLYPVPEAVDFIGAGDFDDDGHSDIVAATRGGNSLFLLR